MLLAGYLILRLLHYRFEPGPMLVWLLVLMFIPFAGALLYARLGENQVMLRAQRKRGSWVRTPLSATEWALDTESLGSFKSAADVGVKLADSPVTGENNVEICSDSNEIHEAWLEAIRGAKTSLHLEYYIWMADDTGAEIRDVVVARAKEGVTCRVIVDAVGSIKMPEEFLTPFHEAGVEFAYFLPLANWKRRWSPHLRNHRKLLIVDGTTGYIGSQNVSDDDRGRNPDFSPWHNLHLEVRGPAVRHMEAVFLDDWAFAAGERIDHFPEPAPAPSNAGRRVQILATGPDCQQHVLERMLLEALNNAERTIDIATPYFVPSPLLRMAILQASLRGARVRIVVTSLTDEKLALYAGRSYYAELLDEGVEIYEYAAGLLHTKLVVVDGLWAMAGSANMDYRSLRLNYEVSALLYDAEPARALADIVGVFCQDARRIEQADLDAKHLRQILLEGAARVLSPQL